MNLWLPAQKFAFRYSHQARHMFTDLIRIQLGMKAWIDVLPGDAESAIHQLLRYGQRQHYTHQHSGCEEINASLG